MLDAVQMDEPAEEAKLDLRAWQNLLELQTRLGTYLRSIGHPDENPSQ